MQVHFDEGVAIHIGPEPCVVPRPTRMTLITTQIVPATVTKAHGQTRWPFGARSEGRLIPSVLAAAANGPDALNTRAISRSGNHRPNNLRKL